LRWKKLFVNDVQNPEPLSMQHKIQRNPERERLVNAAHRFAKISHHDPVKLFYLLYMLDIRSFREIGMSCTGEFYYAMADGPAPSSLRSLLVMRDLDIHAAIGVLTSTDTMGPWYFDPRTFCQCALENLHELETTYREATSRDISLDDDNAWWRIYNKSRGVGAIIPFEMTLGNTQFGCAAKKPNEVNKFVKRFRLSDSNQADFIHK
jgi:hypothetical protein